MFDFETKRTYTHKLSPEAAGLIRFEMTN